MKINVSKLAAATAPSFAVSLQKFLQNKNTDYDYIYNKLYLLYYNDGVYSYNLYTELHVTDLITHLSYHQRQRDDIQLLEITEDEVKEIILF